MCEYTLHPVRINEEMQYHISLMVLQVLHFAEKNEGQRIFPVGKLSFKRIA